MFELRQLTVRDIEDIVRRRVAQFAGLFVAEGSLPPAHVAERSLRLVRSGCPPEWALPFNIVDVPRSTIVGGCGFKGCPDDGVVEMGYGVSPSFQRRGAASFGVAALLQRATASGIVKHVTAHIVPGNVASERVAARSGFHVQSLIADPDGEQVNRWIFEVVQDASSGEGRLPTGVLGAIADTHVSAATASQLGSER